jgi:hypothetical protein
MELLRDTLSTESQCVCPLPRPPARCAIPLHSRVDWWQRPADACEAALVCTQPQWWWWRRQV